MSERPLFSTGAPNCLVNALYFPWARCLLDSGCAGRCGTEQKAEFFRVLETCFGVFGANFGHGHERHGRL